MFKKLILICLVALSLSACERQQKGTGMVMNKESQADFTTVQQTKPKKQKKVPMLPGRAQILGAPFQDFQTQTGTAEVQPSDVKVITPTNGS